MKNQWDTHFGLIRGVVDAMQERIIRVRSRRGVDRGRRDGGDVEREGERDEQFSCQRSVGIKGCAREEVVHVFRAL